MKTIISLIFVLTSFSVVAGDCSQKVKGHYQRIYHKTYKAASNTFLNNFIGRKNMKAHAWGYPEIAFSGPTLFGAENYIAQGILDKTGLSGIKAIKTYNDLLTSGKLCDELGDDYKRPSKIKKLLLEELKND